MHSTDTADTLGVAYEKRGWSEKVWPELLALDSRASRDATLAMSRWCTNMQS